MMRSLRVVVCVLALAMCASEGLRAQSVSDLMHITRSPTELYRGLALGGGMSVIDGTPYYLVHVAPQFQIDDWGFGFDGNFRIGQNGKLRKEDWDETYDYLRWINYVSYGQPHDKLYLRAGGLEHATIGDGVIVSDYTNSSSYDNRRIGLAGRLDLFGLGGEFLTSDIFRRGLVALRPFIRPFELTPLSDVWLIKDIEVGATGVFDFDTNATRVIPNHEPYVTHIKSPTDSTFDSVVINYDSAHYAIPFTTFGADISTMLWKTEHLEGRVYADYVNFQHFNDGFVFGLRTSFQLATALIDLRLERSLFHNQFLPNYYNTFYERDRFDDEARPQDYITKITLLSDSTGGNGNGFRAGGFIDLSHDFQLQATYSHLDNLPGKDWLEMVAVIPDLVNGIYIAATYSRKNINGIGDIIALDDRSLLHASASVRPEPWLIVTAISRWTFSKDDNGHVHTQSMFEPKVDFVFSF